MLNLYLILYFILFFFVENRSIIKIDDHINFKYPAIEVPDQLPIVFSPEIISKGFHEFGVTISPSLNSIFYITSDKNYSKYYLINLRKSRSGWGKPETAEFARAYSVYSAFLSPDSRRLYFSTNRTVNYKSVVLSKNNNWYSEKEVKGWSEPVMINHWFSKDNEDRICSISNTGNIFLTRNIDGKGTDIYYSKNIDEIYDKPIEVSEKINSVFNEGRPFISPDESYIIFQSDRPGGIGGNDIWISFKGINSEWTEPVNFGEPVNSDESEFSPYVSPDGKFLFFSSYRSYSKDKFCNKKYDELIELYSSPRNGYATLYWVSTDILFELKQLFFQNEK